MPTRPLPNDPSLEHLRKEAKRLRKAVQAGDAAAIGQVREFHPRAEEALARFALNGAQLVTARAYGFPSWTRLKEHLAEIEPFVWNTPPPADAALPSELFPRLACLVYGGWHRSNPARALRLLAERPELAEADVYCAAAAGNVRAARAMVEREPALVKTRGGPLRWEPLLYACYSRMEAIDSSRSTLEVARMLLAHGADPNAGFLWGGSYAFTALTGAFGRGEDWDNEPPHPDCDALARLLLDAGADPNDGQTLYNRHFKDNDDHLKLLLARGLGRDHGGPWLKRLRIHENSISNMLAQDLCWAAVHDFPDRVRLLLDHGVDVDAASPRTGRTAYEEALRLGNHAIAEYLLSRGARKVELDPLDAFALACIAGRREEVRARMAQDPELLEKLGPQGRMELLHRAVDAQQREGVRLIVELGVDVNGMVPDSGLDRGALHNAAAWGGLEMVKLLLDLGADPRLRDLGFHAAPVGWAAYARQHEVVEYLLQFANIFDAVSCGGIGRAAELLERDPSLARAADEDGDPLVFHLHPQIARLEEMIGLLTAHGADLNARGSGGKTALDRALARGWIDFADVLRAHGAKTAAQSTS